MNSHGLKPVIELLARDLVQRGVPLRVDDQSHCEATPGGVAQQGERGQRERVVADDEVLGVDLLARVEDQAHALLGRFARRVQQEHLVGGGGKNRKQCQDHRE